MRSVIAHAGNKLFWLAGAWKIRQRIMKDKETEVVYRHPHAFLKFALSHCVFVKRPTSVPVCADQKKSTEDFWLLWKRQKAETAFSVCLAVSRVGGRTHSNSERGAPQRLPRELHSASQPPAPRALNCVCEHVCFLLVCSVHPLARCVLRYQKSLK